MGTINREKIVSIKGNTHYIDLEVLTSEVIRLKGESRRGRKSRIFTRKDPYYGIKDNDQFKELLHLIKFLRDKHFKIPTLSSKALLEISTLYLEIPKIRKVNPKTGRITYHYSQKAHNFVHMIRYLYVLGLRI